MIEWFTYNSTVPMVMGTIMTIIMLAFWIMSRESVMAFIALGVFLLTVGTVACENFIVTPREEVEDTVYLLSTLAQRNDWNAALNYISESKKDVFERARSETNLWECSSCRILGIKDYLQHSETSAQITFVAHVEVHMKDHPGDNFAQVEFTIDFEKEEGQWRIMNYSHSDPRAGITL